jgi:hypothetical protein
MQGAMRASSETRMPLPRRAFAPPRRDAVASHGVAVDPAAWLSGDRTSSVGSGLLLPPETSIGAGLARPSGAAREVPGNGARLGGVSGSETGMPVGQADGGGLGAALARHFWREARLPPATGSAFDPSLTPAWAGVKLPL